MARSCIFVVVPLKFIIAQFSTHGAMFTKEFHHEGSTQSFQRKAMLNIPVDLEPATVRTRLMKIFLFVFIIIFRQ